MSDCGFPININVSVIALTEFLHLPSRKLDDTHLNEIGSVVNIFPNLRDHLFFCLAAA